MIIVAYGINRPSFCEGFDIGETGAARKQSGFSGDIRRHAVCMEHGHCGKSLSQVIIARAPRL